MRKGLDIPIKGLSPQENGHSRQNYREETSSNLKTSQILVGSSIEAKTLYKSTQFSDSYDFPWNPDDLVSGNDYMVYDEMKNDDQIKAAISFKKDMIINTGWKIECEKDEIKQFITDCLENINQSNNIDLSFEDSLRDILSSFEYGFSLTEPVYFVKDGKIKYKCLKTRPPHSFKFHVDDYGRIEKITQSTNMAEKEYKTSLFIHHTYQQEFGNPYGKSDLRAAHQPWKIKKFIQRFYAMYLERFAQPTVIGKYPNTTDSNEIARLQNMLKTIQTATTFVLPEGMNIELLFPARDAGDGYVKAIDLFNMQIARSILVPDLLGIGGGQTSGGSYSLGREQFRFFLGTIKKDRESLERKINLKIVRPLVLMNFGDIPCKFQFVDYTNEDVSKYLELWISAVNGKIFKPNPEEVNHLRALTGFPEGDVSIPEPPPTPMDGMQRRKTPKEDSNLEDDLNIKKRDDEQDDVNFANMAREKTSYESKVNFTEIAKILKDSDDNVGPDLLEIGQVIYNDLIEQIKDKGILTKFRPEKINEIQPKYQGRMKTIFKNHFRELFRESITRARNEILPNGTKASSFTEDQLKIYAKALVPDDFVDVIEAEAFKIVGDYSFVLTKKLKNLLADAIKQGKSEDEITSILKKSLKTETETWITTVVRTKTTEIYNNARRSYWENDPIASQIIEAYQFSAIIDTRTSDICSNLDGQVYSKDDAHIDRVTPPLHFNCRSILVPITKFEEFKSSSVPPLDKINSQGGNLKGFKQNDV